MTPMDLVRSADVESPGEMFVLMLGGTPKPKTDTIG